MNRRDTILVAVLVNVALVLGLFICGIKPASPIELAKRAQEEKEPEITKDHDDPSSSIDQVDQLLSKYISQGAEKEVKEENKPAGPAKLAKPAVQKVAEVKPNKEPKVKEVIIKQGDMLEKIARAHKCSVDEIMRLNSLTSTRLQIGQILYVPATAATPPQTQAPPSSKEAKYYIVKNGDNPWTIAIKNKIRVEKLLRLNGLDEAKAKKLKPGDRLRIE